MDVMKGIRVPERLYKGVLWLVSIIFAGFLIGFGNLVIGDLPQVEDRIERSDYVESAEVTELRGELRDVQQQSDALNDRLDLLRIQRNQAASEAQSAKETFEAWIQTRTATTDPTQDPEVIRRTRELEQLQQNERSVQSSISELETERTQLDQRSNALYDRISDAELTGIPAYEQAQFWQELRIFGLRLLITLPMLAFAAYLIVKRRKGEYWPISRGFVLAAVFVFFVELVPYLPSYGGYIRYGVGIILTFAAGHFLIKNMRQYLANRQEVEQKAEEERRKLVSHDEAFKKMSSSVCPGCDRPIAKMEGTETNFCVHCGMTLFDHCSSCDTRKMAFFRFCMKCGTVADDEPATPSAAPAPT
ncbi:zinc ribbon domain-containing protein [Altererythrobacter lutimaris]|uniref:Zinc ribbon domain-containing protein n=1 Tax=Altererythrobacter lutimaris TaxID=2743979 RepID=A0A850HAB7_9SPHN|nr:zinc ribbon domain-containing protein [Altererythrobacter lutimaris]NVE93398.1 zinc ribbon domain-containing protein [Altererythrobacter lutimaris]